MLADLTRLAGKVPVAQLALRQAEIPACGTKLDAFAKALAVAAGASSHSAMPG